MLPFTTTLFRSSSLKAGLICLAACCSLWYFIGQDKPKLLAAIDTRIVDSMFRLRGSQETSGAVVIVDIDEKSLKEHGQWPWPRDLLAELTRRIYAASPRVVGFDILFAETDRTSPARFFDRYHELFRECPDFSGIRGARQTAEGFDHDRLLGQAIAGGPGVLSFGVITQNDGAKNPTTPLPTLRLLNRQEEISALPLFVVYRAITNIAEVSTSTSEGFFNLFPDASGMVSKAPLFLRMDDRVYPSLAFEVFRVGKGLHEARLESIPTPRTGSTIVQGVWLGDSFYPTDQHGQLTINFRGPYPTFLYLSASDILKGAESEVLRGKYVLVGSSASGMMNAVPTPLSVGLPGVEVHATIIDNLLNNDALVWASKAEIGLTYTLLIGGGLLMLLALVFLGPISGFALALAVPLAIIVADYSLFFLSGRLVGPTFLIASLLTLLTTVTLTNYLVEAKRKSFIRRTFSRYVAPSVVNQLLKTPEKFHLTAETREVTVLFCDIRNFTSLAEKTPPAELSTLLNDYFSLLTGIITAHHGMVDKYIGDAIMAVWGTPLDDPRHRENAIRAALAIDTTVSAQSDRLRLAGRPISIGIGINTGKASAGNFGSNDRFAYTVLGDTVNLAARLEQLTRYYQVKIIAAESTVAASEIPHRTIDTVTVKGRLQPVRLFEPLTCPVTPAFQKILDLHERAISTYQNRQFAAAEQLFATLFADSGEELHRIYQQRCRNLLEKPPPENWLGVHHH
ncbi:MAG: adenylate/guanylate cyclase domain-containing protein [Desulforhopalus sp.]|jgi:adenylate cyclase|nr:adenylate/guanylate cyclase domain-containing protein [Desulforhopalus sp.]